MKKTVFALARSSQTPQNRPRQSQSSIINYQLSILLLLALLAAPARAKYSGGTGEPNNPYKIADYNDIYALADDANDYNKCFCLTADIDLRPTLPGRRPLTTALIAPDVNSTGGFQGNAFTGTFDGNDFHLLNLTINTNGADNDYLGLFGQTDTNAVISNLGLRDVNITGGTESYYLGGLVGWNDYGNVTNCYATGEVTGNGDYVGGLVGWSHPVSSVTNCYATGVVSGYDYVGGLVGYTDSFSSVTNCYATGAVAGNYCVGGLVGVNTNGTVTSSFWDIERSGTTASDGGMGLTTSQMQQGIYYAANYWGGTTWTIDEGNDYPHLAWENAPGEFITDPDVTMAGSGTPEDPWVIESKDDFTVVRAGPFFWDKHYILNTDIDLSGVTYASVLIGYDNDNPFTGSFDGNDHIISNLTTEGEDYLGLFACIGPGGSVSNLGLEDANIIGTGFYVGGLVGWNYGSVTNCYATGAVSGVDYVGGLVGENYGTVAYCYATGAVSGGGGVGGLVGSNGDRTTPSASITNCYATGPVTGDDYIGGLVGWNSRGSVSNCYATGAVYGLDSVGGFVGYNQYGSVTNCYATGPLTGVQDVGGLVGSDYESGGVFVSSYFLDPNDGGGPDNGIGEPLTDEEMKQQASFLDWDFVGPADGPNDFWSICETMNYPKLLWSIPLADMLCPDGVTFSDYSYFADHWLWTDYGDVNGIELSGNGKIENADFALFANWWGQAGCGDCGGADYNGDNAVDSADLAILFTDWLATDYGDCEGAELTGDGFVGIDDALAFSELWLSGF